MVVEARITEKLKAAFEPSSLAVVNDSHLHAGHVGSPGTGESHFTVTILSDRFSGKSRLERHRMVNEVLAEELAGDVHALSIKAIAPTDGGGEGG